MKGTTSEFERRVCGRQRPYDYAVQPDLQNQQIIQLTIRDTRFLGCAVLRNNTLCITTITHLKA